MNAGEVATRLGLPGVPQGGRDDRAGARRAARGADRRALPRRHDLAAPRASAVVRAAKARKLPVTCGVSINHLTLNENDIGPYRTFFRLKPPLRARGRPRRHGARARPPATST